MRLFLIVLLTLTIRCYEVYAQVILPAKIDLSIIAQIESSGVPFAYNSKTKAVGLYQLTLPAVTDYNSYHKDKFILNEMFDPDKAYIVANWYINERIPKMLKHYGQPVTLETVLQAYNCGIGCVVKNKMPLETIDYIQKYKKLSGRL